MGTSSREAVQAIECLFRDLGHPGADPVELGHNYSVNAMAVLADGRLVTGGPGTFSADLSTQVVIGGMLVWDPAHTGANPVKLSDTDIALWTMAALADGRVVTGGPSGQLLTWDPAHPEADPEELGRADGTVWTMAALPNGRVVTGDSDGRLLMWDPPTFGGNYPDRIQHTRWIEAVAFLADGRVVTGDFGGQVLMWDPAEPGGSPTKLGKHLGWVQAVAVLPDGRVAAAGEVGSVIVCDPSNPSTELTLGNGDGMFPDMFYDMAVLPDGRVVTVGRSRHVLIWDPAHPETGPVELGRNADPALRILGVSLHAVAALADGRVVTAGAERRLLIWDPAHPQTGRSSSAATAVRCRQWRRCPTGGWSPAGPTDAYWSGIRPGSVPTRPSSPAMTGRLYRRSRCWPTGG